VISKSDSSDIEVAIESFVVGQIPYQIEQINKLVQKGIKQSSKKIGK